MRHFLSLKDYSPAQILSLVQRAAQFKLHVKQGSLLRGQNVYQPLSGKTLAMLFSKRSTRTRVSAETAWSYLGGYPMFLGKDDIQMGAGEPIKDTAIVISSMSDAILARVGQHEEVETLAEHSSVPVINALSAKYHPLQILADVLTLYETFAPDALLKPKPLPMLHGIKVAWVGDANNILNSMMVTLPRLGISLGVATPKGYKAPPDVVEYTQKSVENIPSGTRFRPGNVLLSHEPALAIKSANVIVTDTWISMGQEAEKQKRLKDFSGLQISEHMAKKYGANKDWKFMHCLPRKREEVTDDVFYNNKRSLVFEEAENRKYTIMAVFDQLLK